jgi:two-component system sensor kinase FixL
VILNLILNGIEALESVPEGTRRLTVQTRRQNGVVEVTVSDTGGGIIPEKQARLFDYFFTTKKNGMGLGLAISRSIIDVHRGKIWVENNSLGGATLRFAIPTEPTAGRG